MHPVLGFTEPYPVAVILGTGYQRFESPSGLGGLVKWTDERLDVLAVHASVKGQGQFREFIATTKKHWKTVCVWEDWNPIVSRALQKYGFTREVEIQGDGEVIRGWRWDAKS